MVKLALNQIIEVTALRDRLMTAAGTMNMVCVVARAPEFQRAVIWVLGAHLDRMLLVGVAIDSVPDGVRLIAATTATIEVQS